MAFLPPELKRLSLTKSLLSTGFILFYILSAIQGAEQNTKERVLRFPKDKTVGILFTRPQRIDGYDIGKEHEGWERLGEARGELRIAEHSDVQLELNSQVSSDLSFLENLQPDDLQSLILRNAQVSEEGFRKLGLLTGLKLLYLTSIKVTDQNLAHLKSLKNLKFFRWMGYRIEEKQYRAGDDSLGVLAKLPALKELMFIQSNITNKGLIHLRESHSLRVLTLMRNEITSEGLKALKDLSELEHLILGGTKKKKADIDDTGLQHLSALNQLKTLRLNNTRITDSGLKNLRDFQRLESLSLADTQVTNTGLVHLIPLKSLQSIRLYGLRLTDEDMKPLSKISSLQRIDANLSISDKGLRLLTKLRDLESLDLSSKRITDLGMAHLAEMKSLKTLWFQGCPITDFGLEQLTGLESLEMLMLNDTHITDEGLQFLGKLPLLKRLVVKFSPDALSINRKKSALRHLEKLKHLESFQVSGTALANNDLISVGDYLSGIKQFQVFDMVVDDEGIRYLSELTSLKLLFLEKTLITDQGMRDLSYMPRLESLTISAPITDKGLIHLKNMKSLKFLQIASPHITDKGIDRLKRSLPALQSVRRNPYRPAQ